MKLLDIILGWFLGKSIAKHQKHKEEPNKVSSVNNSNHDYSEHDCYCDCDNYDELDNIEYESQNDDKLYIVEEEEEDYSDDY